MKYPKFLSSNSNIGISPLSAGVGRKLDSFDLSLSQIKEKGYNILETPSVRVDSMRPADALTRANEFMSLVHNKEIDFIINASGGYYAYEVLEFLDFHKISIANKWIMGYSDPTSVLYNLTTNYDLSTVYGYNAGSFDQEKLHPSLNEALDMLGGKIIQQNSSEFHDVFDAENYDDFKLDHATKWVSNRDKMEVKGRIIGGCIEVLNNLFGTKYDGFKKFEKKYKKDGIIWYFDIYDMKAADFYLKLLHMKTMGYFENTNAVLVGRALMQDESFMTYDEAAFTALEGINVITQMDIGHTNPKMYILNGSIAELNYENGKGSIKFELI